jgi:hypothetical protein
MQLGVFSKGKKQKRVDILDAGGVARLTQLLGKLFFLSLQFSHNLDWYDPRPHISGLATP